MKTKSALPWFGSDASIAADLGSLLNRCKHVTIPFAGGLSILPHLPARAVVANDLHCHAINFYRTLSDDREGFRDDLIDLCRDTLSHPDQMREAVELLDAYADPSLNVEVAWAFWAYCWLGRKGQAGTRKAGRKPSVRWTANGGTNGTRLASAVADLDAWAEHFRRCEFTCLDYAEVLAKVKDRPDCGIYCDPPWPDAGDDYVHRFTEQDHRTLAWMLTEFDETAIVVRYGDHPLIREIYADCRWTILEASSRTQANATIGELWIIRADQPRPEGW